MKLGNNDFEIGIAKYRIEIGNSENIVNISELLAIIYCVA